MNKFVGVDITIEKYRSKFGASSYIQLVINNELLSSINFDIEEDIAYVFYTRSNTVINIKKSINSTGYKIKNSENIIKIPIRIKELNTLNLEIVNIDIYNNTIQIYLKDPIWNDQFSHYKYYSARESNNDSLPDSRGFITYKSPADYWISNSS